jgi:NAD dependent epimerase/dehydratase family enzyme
MPVPGAALNLLYGREFGETIKGGQRVIPRRTTDLGYSFRHPDLEEALRDLLGREAA